MDCIPSISPDDLQYHQEVLATAFSAEMLKEHWFKYLASKYKLAENQSINPDGSIIDAK